METSVPVLFILHVSPSVNPAFYLGNLLLAGAIAHITLETVFSFKHHGQHRGRESAHTIAATHAWSTSGNYFDVSNIYSIPSIQLSVV